MIVRSQKRAENHPFFRAVFVVSDPEQLLFETGYTVLKMIF